MRRRTHNEWYWQVGSDLSRLSEEMNSRRPRVASTKYWEPRADVMDFGDRFSVRVELPGIRGEDVAVQYDADQSTLAIRGVRRTEEAESGRQAFYQLEIPYGEFERVIVLPQVPIRLKGIRVLYRNGFLLIDLPKADRVVVKSTVIIERV